MDFEQWVKDTPKPLVAAVFIGVFIFIWVFIISPPHTICDTQTENLKTSQAGILFPKRTEVIDPKFKGKVYLPVIVQRARQSCEHGNSVGSCYEFFDIMKKLSSGIKRVSSECYSSVGGISIEKYYEKPVCPSGIPPEECNLQTHRNNVTSTRFESTNLKGVIADAIQIMVMKAWGEVPPEPGPFRLGWFQETEIAVYCHLKDVYTLIAGDMAWEQLRKTTYQQLPGQRSADAPAVLEGELMHVPRATDSMTELDIFQRSLFSVRCDMYR